MEVLIFILALTFCTYAHGQDLPPDAKTYRAVGELVSHPNESDPNLSMQLLFEENYDAEGKRSSLTITTIDIAVTIVEYLDLKQMFIYNKASKQCQPFSMDEFVGSQLDPIPIKNLIIKDDNAIFPVRQLLSMRNSGPSNWSKKGNILYRNIPATTWTYGEQDGPGFRVEVDVYWSTENYTSPSKTKQVPLGYQVKKEKTEIPDIVSVNFFLFTHNEVNYGEFEPPKGVYCPGRADSVQFPDVSKIAAIAYQSEYVWESFRTFSTIDAWLDPETKLYRVDMIPTQTFNLNPKEMTRIVSNPQGVLYEITRSRATQCDVRDLTKEEFDPQTIIDYRKDDEWSIESLFGIKSTKYASVGEITDRGIPCILYHGVRKDWPKEGENITSLWEWCVANDKTAQLDFPGGRYPVISLNIYIIQSPFTESTGMYYEGLRFTHQFHNVKEMDQKYMNAAFFDIRDCFEDENVKELSFTVKVEPEDLKNDISNFTSDATFIGAWKNAINKASDLAISSMRISGLKMSSVSGQVKIYFTLLGRHPNLPTTYKEGALVDVFNKLRSSIDNNQLVFDTERLVNGKQVKIHLSAVGGSLSEKQSKVKQLEEPLTYSSGVMAAVSIIMLLFGVAVGMGAVFTKHTYFDRK